jgi:hypothetical protein
MPQANDATDDIATVLRRTGKQFETLRALRTTLLFSEPGLKAELEAALATLRCKLRQ